MYHTAYGHSGSDAMTLWLRVYLYWFIAIVVVLGWWIGTPRKKS